MGNGIAKHAIDTNISCPLPGEDPGDPLNTPVLQHASYQKLHGSLQDVTAQTKHLTQAFEQVNVNRRKLTANPTSPSAMDALRKSVEGADARVKEIYCNVVHQARD